MKKTVWTIIIIAVAAVGIWLWSSGAFQKNEITEPTTEGLPQLPEVGEGDTTAEIQNQLEQIDLGDIDEQFEQIDSELNNL